MPTPVTESSEGGQHVEWSETFHSFLFRARIYLKRYWWILIFTIAAGVFVQAWKKHNTLPQYRSEAEMMVNAQISFGTTTAAEYNENLANFFKSQMHLMMNQELKDETMATLKANEPQYIPALKAGTIGATGEVGLIQDTSILHLFATGPDPKFTQDYLEQWMATFLKRRRDQRAQTLNEAGISIDEEAKSFRDQVTEAQKKIEDFLNKNTTGTVQSQIDSASTKLVGLTEDIEEINSQLRVLGWTPPPPVDAPAPGAAASGQVPEEEPLSKQLKFKAYLAGTNADQLDPQLVASHLLPLNPEYQQAKDQLLSIRAQYEELRVGAGTSENPLGLDTEHPKMRTLSLQIKDLENKLNVLRNQRVDLLGKLKASLISTLDNKEKEADSWKSRLIKSKELENTYDVLRTDLDMKKDIVNKLLQNSTYLDSSKGLGTEMLRINQHATPASVLGSNPVREIGQGAFVGLAGGFLIIFLLGALDGRVMSVEDLTQRFDEPMLGVIPMQKRTGGQVELLKNNDQRQMFAESCRNIRSSLLYMDRAGQRPRIIMLTSSMPSEGKSTLSANLAITLGFAASRTLLVDADMRRGQLHKRFNVKNDVGLAEHIKDGVPLKQVIQNTGFENLDFIPCGQYPDQPGELLMSERFEESIAALKEHYDFVIFDSPPILLTDDAASFATRADAVIFVVRAGYTRLRQVRTSMESLHRRGVNVYGMVVNFIDHREPGYYSYRYYDYYSYKADSPSRKDRAV